mgnify:CR=1 FL=1
MDSDEIYPYGWAPKGLRCEAQKQGSRSTRERINLVAGLKEDALLAPVIFTGYCDGIARNDKLAFLFVWHCHALSLFLHAAATPTLRVYSG